MFEVYTYFGRVLGRFIIGDNETHHKALEDSRKFLLDKEKQGITCWVRYKR